MLYDRGFLSRLSYRLNRDRYLYKLHLRYGGTERMPRAWDRKGNARRSLVAVISAPRFQFFDAEPCLRDAPSYELVFIGTKSNHDEGQNVEHNQGKGSICEQDIDPWRTTLLEKCLKAPRNRAEAHAPSETDLMA